ncbi:MAG: class I SAM-dependent rRNA methyltransferase, partial [Proteobacteria bacterium]|nr:class I SAM-dependent rRNA methyltransferase [Pseudomonadota bacterium]
MAGNAVKGPLLLTPVGVDYVLLDSGHGRKLERLGGIVTDRPEPQAIWAPKLPESEWQQAAAVFSPKSGKPGGDDDGEGGNWEVRGNVPERWKTQFESMPFYARLTPFRHLGCFPDQSPQWRWLRDEAKSGMKVLNLFGYTGVASLVAAKAGAEVVHVDASKKAIGFARESAEIAGLTAAPIRWICDDALAFVQREVRRGNRYDIIILDPPKYGRGPDGERWEFFADMPKLMIDMAKISNPLCKVWLTAYALRVSSVALGSMLLESLGSAG